MIKEEEILTVDDIQKAVAAVKAARPSYEELLDFYENLFVAQERAREQVQLKPIHISDELLSIKQKEGFPLVSKTDFMVDVKGAEALMREICQVGIETNEVMAEAGDRLIEALNTGTLESSILFSDILDEDSHSFEKVAQELGVDEKILAFLTYSSVRPSLLLCAEVLAAYLHTDTLWDKGYCPICGSPPGLSILREEGQRSLVCSFCGHQWETRRICCPFCNNQDHTKLHYFFGEEEKGYRVDVCNVCKRYIKTVDTRELKHPFYPLLEQISTWHLDLLAQEQGLESGSPSWLQI